jgi:hypothetical protein
MFGCGLSDHRHRITRAKNKTSPACRSRPPAGRGAEGERLNVQKPLIASPPSTVEEEEQVCSLVVHGQTALEIGAQPRTQFNIHDKAAITVKARQIHAAGRARTEGEGQMTGRIPRPWTPEEDERLRKLAAENRSSLTISERLKRAPKSIRHRARKLNIVLAKVQGSFRE